ncbi:MAG: hypothetical protein O7H39_08255 [Gammaproteobacteria bacterium]|nr:hypothetical protein [Gammaproteobacteria bacterium]
MSTPAACAMATAFLAMVTASPGASATKYTAAIISDGVRVHVTVEASEPGLDVGWLTIRLRRGESLVALWHTHGSRGFGREQFSSGDVALARRLAIPIFLTNPKGHLARYDPPSQDCGRRSEPTPGKRIGHVRSKDFVCG